MTTEMRKKVYTLTSISLIALIGWAVGSALFGSSLETIKNERAIKEQRYLHFQQLLSRKSDYEKAWKLKQSFMDKASRPQEAQNRWIRQLLDYAGSHGLQFEKVEPMGIREIESGHEIQLYLTFQGGIQKLVHFFHYLLEKDPFTRFDGIKMKREEDAKHLLYEVTLVKVIA